MSNVAPTERSKRVKTSARTPSGRLGTNSELAAHLSMSKSNVRYMEECGVLTRTGSGWDLDKCRAAYIHHLREGYRQSPRAQLEADLAKKKSRLLQIRIAKAEGELMPVREHDAALEELCGFTLTKFGSWPARLAGNDLVLRRRAEALINELRRELAVELNERARAQDDKDAKDDRRT